MKLRIIAVLFCCVSSGLAVDSVQFALPEKAQYLLSMTLTQESRAGQRKTSRNAQMTANVELSKSDTGHRIAITYLTHYETVTGQPSSGDMRGLKIVYDLNSIGKVTNVEGLDEVLKRSAAATTSPSSMVAKAIELQKKALSEQCELIAASLVGKPTRPGMQWKEVQIVKGMSLTPKPVTRDMTSVGPMTCGLGECFAVEGTYQYNSSDEVARSLEAIYESTGVEPVLPSQVDSSWDSARFRILVQPETGLVAGYSENILGSTVIRTGPQTVKEERSRKIEFTLRNLHLERRPLKPTVVVP